MISTRYFENRGKELLRDLQDGKIRRAVREIPGSTAEVLNRWVKSVYVCPRDSCFLC